MVLRVDPFSMFYFSESTYSVCDGIDIGTIMTIPRDRVKPSPMPDSWKLREIFLTAVTLGSYLALMTVIFFWAMIDTDFFPVLISKIEFILV